uniref:Uncharacterized protein n=1 Tax=Rhizophora mucronata TaxID=61149 RepID=A0A2P2NIQ3_RHIMU
MDCHVSRSLPTICVAEYSFVSSYSKVVLLIVEFVSFISECCFLVTKMHKN